ncbi:hypothetical protein ACIBF1_44130 [Spirillospora sp. NPDC050679]
MATKRRRALPDIEGAPIERGVGPSREEAHASSLVPAPRTDGLPDPYETTTDGELSHRERTDLKTCEAAIDGLRLAFWAAGKALQTIRDARLYRETHATFEDYVQDRWEFSRPQAYRLIAAWPLAERLSPIGDTALNEGQVRELLPLADRHGQDAAVTVYRTVAETDGVRVTAAVLKGAVAVLPADEFDPDKAAAQIRAYLAGELKPTASPPLRPAEFFAAEVDRMRAVLRRTAKAPRAERRKFAAELRALADELDQS